MRDGHRPGYFPSGTCERSLEIGKLPIPPASSFDDWRLDSISLTLPRLSASAIEHAFYICETVILASLLKEEVPNAAVSFLLDLT